MKFSGKLCAMIILKVTKKQGFMLTLENTVFEKTQRGGGWGGGRESDWPFQPFQD